MSTEPPSKEYKAYCPVHAMITEKRHTEQSAKELCERHNKNADCGSAYTVPICWVCGDKATHQNQKPPHEYTCDDHALSIDMIPLEDTE